MSRLLRILKLIMGPGRWDAEALARELECSRRTVHRDLQTLSMAGVPWRYDEQSRAYRVQSGFRFPGLATSESTGHKTPVESQLLASARHLLQMGEEFLSALRELSQTLEMQRSSDER